MPLFVSSSSTVTHSYAPLVFRSHANTRLLSPALLLSFLMSSTFRPSGRRRAILVGINYPRTRSALKGCVRDATYLHHLLTTRFSFNPSNVTLLVDQRTSIRKSPHHSPTRANILYYLRSLVNDARPGDSLFFSFSGHGSQVRDYSGDESDGYDETLLPSDHRSKGPIVDDELWDIVKRLVKGARLTVLIDACHSGTGMDLPYQHDVFGTGSGQKKSGGRVGVMGGLMGVVGGFLEGGAKGAVEVGVRWAGNYVSGGNGKNVQSRGGQVLMFAGCRDRQTSADTSKMAGLRTGALTYAFVEACEKSRSWSYRALLREMRFKMREKKLKQVPQFSTSVPFDIGQRFAM